MKSKIIKITAFLLLVIVGCFITFHFSNKEKVKADTPSLYYFTYDDSFVGYTQIILYVQDVVVLNDLTCEISLLAYHTGTYQYALVDRFPNATFLRYSQLDYDDWDAYVFNFQYYSSNEYIPFIIWVGSSSSITGVDFVIDRDYAFPYKPYKELIRQEGYDDGYHDGTNDRNAYWEDYIQETYESTTGSGYQRIFEDGRTAGYRQGQESIDTTDWLQTVATDVGSILNIKLMPFITIGGLIFIPLMFTILGAILWIWRKK